MLQLPNGSQFGYVDGRRKKSKTGEDGSYQTAQAMETEENRKARLEKIVANTQLRLAFETEEEGRAKNGLIW